MKTKCLIVFLVISIIVVVFVLIQNEKGISSYFFWSGKKQTTAASPSTISNYATYTSQNIWSDSRKNSSQTNQITYSTIEKMMQNNEMIKNLPQNAILLLRFYRYNSIGEIIWEKSYIIKKGKVEEGIIENPDIVFWIPSNYLNYLTTNNLCEVINLAKSNQELSIRTQMSKTSLLWKYRSMFKYRSCFGF
ncbi:MAG: hypothetical protein QXF25_01145 [Candidatus Pacearchaeota archaeon]